MYKRRTRTGAGPVSRTLGPASWMLGIMPRIPAPRLPAIRFETFVNTESRRIHIRQDMPVHENMRAVLGVAVAQFHERDRISLTHSSAVVHHNATPYLIISTFPAGSRQNSPGKHDGHQKHQ